MSLVLRVTGGNKFQKSICNDTIQFAINRLLPNIRKLDVNIQIKKFKDDDDCIGYCLDDSSDPVDYVGKSPRRFVIEISNALNLTEFIRCILHEFIHLKQYVLGEMEELGDGSTRWKSRACSRKMKYHDTPWEKEAYRLESRLMWEALEIQEFKIG